MPATIKAAVTQAASKMHDVIAELGNPCAFTLRSGATFTIPGTLSGRTEDDLTPGLDQDMRVLTVSARAWRSSSPGRNPEKGDLVVVEGQRHRVMDAILDAAGGVQIRWRLMVKG